METNAMKTKTRKIECPYCRIPMKYRGAQRIQLGRWGLILSHLDNLLSGSLNTGIRMPEVRKAGNVPHPQ